MKIWENHHFLTLFGNQKRVKKWGKWGFLRKMEDFRGPHFWLKRAKNTKIEGNGPFWPFFGYPKKGPKSREMALFGEFPEMAILGQKVTFWGTSKSRKNDGFSTFCNSCKKNRRLSPSFCKKIIGEKWECVFESDFFSGFGGDFSTSFDFWTTKKQISSRSLLDFFFRVFNCD